MRPPLQLLYLSRASIAQAALSLAEVEGAVERAFRAKAEGNATLPPKAGFRPTAASAFFLPMPAALHTPPVAGIKWVTVGHGNLALGLPSVAALVVLNDLETGVPTAVLDGSWITAVRTAAASAIAARHLARKDSRRIGFIACGLQARSNFAALKACFPLEEAVLYSRRRETAEAFAAELAAEGMRARVVTEPSQAVAGMDIVVTSVPPEPGPHRFLDPDWLSPGAFATLVDLGRSWCSTGFERLDRIVTDDRTQTAANAKASGLPYGGPFHAEIGEIIVGTARARAHDEERIVFLHPGIALADLALAHEIRERAIARELGVWLPL
jgi:ornithine cyclodeaminase/alanine dehydrogenase